MTQPSQHVTVLLAEVLEWLDPQKGQTFVDGTLGAGGHARALAERVGPTGLVIALDRDPATLEAAERELARRPVTLVHSDFRDLPEVLRQLEVPGIDGMVLDLGMSSDQLADSGRGFSFDSPGPLDLRYDPGEGEPATRLVNHLRSEQLADLLAALGEERYSRRIARAIVEARKGHRIETATELAAIVRGAVPRGRGRERIDAATRTFQALRIAVNDELRSLEIALRRIPECLRTTGRLAVISFHSLEDRLVKQAFREDPRYEAPVKKPIQPSAEEVLRNPRSRSAKLRVARRR